jgi:ferric-dicitrate binding protein FerR (iron transport regulator)
MKHPFTINAGNTCLKVLGTSFNLSAYKDENKVEIVLQKGKIEFINDRKDQRSIILPSEKLIYQEGKVNKTFVDPSKYTSWTEGKLVFKGEPMGEVIRKIERCYNVKIILADREIENYSFRGTFKDDKIEDVIRFICMTSSLDYKIIHRDRLTNVPEKDVVTIFRKN